MMNNLLLYFFFVGLAFLLYFDLREFIALRKVPRGKWVSVELENLDNNVVYFAYLLICEDGISVSVERGTSSFYDTIRYASARDFLLHWKIFRIMN